MSKKLSTLALCCLLASGFAFLLACAPQEEPAVEEIETAPEVETGAPAGEPMGEEPMMDEPMMEEPMGEEPMMDEPMMEEETEEEPPTE